MTVQSARPDVAQLSFMLYDRALHPELFSTIGSRSLKSGNWEAKISICGGGHVVSLRTSTAQLTEIAGHHSADELPSAGQRIAFGIQSGRESSLEMPGNLQVHFSSHVDTLAPAVFTELHQELEIDARDAWLLHVFPSAQRLRPQPLSMIRVETQADSLLLHTFHTFPDNFAVLRTQSLYEFGTTSSESTKRAGS